MYLPGVCAPEFSGNPETILLSEQQFPTRMRGQSFKQLQSGFDQRETFHRGDSYILQQPGAAGGGAGGGAGAKNVEIIKTIKTVHNSNSLTKRYAAARAGVDECELKLRQAEVLLQNDLKGFEVGQPGRNRIEIDNLLKMCGDMISEIEEAIEDLKYSGQPFEPIQNRVVQLYDQLRVISKAIYERYSEQVVIEHVKLPGQRVSIGNNSWDESYSRSTHELVSWINQQKQVMGVQEWALDAVSVEEQIKEQKRYHKIIEDFRWKINKVKVEQNENYSENYRLAISEVEDQYEGLLKGSNERIDQLIRFQDIIKVASNEIMWINDREEEELVYDWSDKNTNIAEKQERFSMLMSNLEVKEKQLNRLKQEGDKLVANQHPAANRIEAYVDALQTQWSWVLQLTKCIEVHLKENTNYFQFFEEAQMVEKDLKKMQDSIRKKFICDKSTPALQLEKMITESEKDKDKILEYKRQMTNLVNKSKNIVQLKPRNPLTNADQRSGNKIILKALCDYKQDQKAVHKDDKCILLDNSQRSKWKVIGPGGIEMMVPSVCLLIPPPNHAANDLANKIEQYYEAILSLWNQLYINMKSLMSWQYCIMDMQKIRSWTLLMLKQMSREDYETVTKNLELNFQAFLKYSKTSQFFTEADRTELQKDYSHSQTHFSKLVTSLEDGPPDRQISVKVLGQGPPQSDSNFHLALQTIRHRLEENEQLLLQKIHLLIDSASTFNNTRRTAELELTLDDLDAIDNDFVKLQKKWHLSNPSLESKLFFEKEFLFIAQRLKSASRYSTDYLERMKVLNLLIQSILEVEDIVKVYEARLTEEESVPLDLDKIEPYRFYLKTMRGELDMKRDLLKHMDDDLNQVLNINERITSSYKCDIDIDKYNEKVTQLKDRWQRIYKELDSRYLDLDKHHRQLNDYKQLFDGLNRWIDVTKCKQDALQINKFGHAEAIIAQLQEQKNLHSEIKNKRVNVEEYQSDADMCATSIKDYELQLASFSAGLETLLKIPIKRQVAQSASTNILRESADLQSRYIELLTRSGDYYKCLSEMLKNTEEVKIKNTKIELLEEELKHAKGENADSSQQKKFFDQHLSQIQVEITELRKKVVILEEQRRSAEMERDNAKHSLEVNISQMKEINEKITRLTFELEEERRLRISSEKLKIEQKDEHDSVFHIKQKELDDVIWLKVQIEKTLKEKEHEIQRLRKLLEEESNTRREIESELVKIKNKHGFEMTTLKSHYETQIKISESTIEQLSIEKDDTSGLKIKLDNISREKSNLQEEIERLKISIKQSELHRTKAEENIAQQRASGTHESRKRLELEREHQQLIKIRSEEILRHKAFQEDTSKCISDKTRELERVKVLLEEEIYKRKNLENDNDKLKQLNMESQKKTTDSFTRIHTVEEEYKRIKMDYERASNEKNRSLQEIERLQSTIREANHFKVKIEEEIAQQKRYVLEESSKRKKAEEELECIRRSCKEYTITISQLTQQIEQISFTKKKLEDDLKEQRISFEHQFNEKKVSTEELNRLYAEIEKLRHQLTQEQDNLRQAHLRNEHCQKTIEDKSKSLNESITEIERLRSLVEKLTKERLRLEEECRNIRISLDDFQNKQNENEGEKGKLISELKYQLELTSKRTADLQKLINELKNEREKLKVEVEIFQKQALEATNKIEITRISREEILHEKESLLLKIRLLEQDKSRLQHYEDELSRIKALLETESRSKLHMQDEIQHVKTDLTYWKSQAEMKDQAIRHQELDKGKATSELDRLKAEITRLEEELRMLEERCKWKLATADREKQSELEALRIQLQMEIQRLSEVPKKEIKLLGIRDHVSLHELVNSEVIDEKTASDIETGRITAEEVSHKYQDLLQGKSSIAGIFVEATREKLSVYQAMRKGLIRRGTALELLEAQAATGHMIDPVKNLKLTVEQAAQSGLIGLEFKNKLLSAEKAVTGYKDPETGKLISLFQAMKKELIEPTHGIRLLEAQIATGGIIDPTQSHRLPVHTAYKRNYFDEEMNQILIDPGDDTKGFFDPNTEENLTYLQLMERCVTDKVTNLCLLQLTEKKKTTTSTSAVRKRRIVIVDPDTNREMSVREAYHKDLIDYETFVELSEQEAEWEEITISGSDGSVKTVVVDRKTGIQYDIEDYLKKGLIDKKSFDDYRAGVMSLTQFAELFSDKTNVDTRNVSKLHHSTNRSPSPSPQFTKTLFVSSDEFSPIAAIFDIETLEKITISEAVRRNIVDSITGQRLLEAQACTGGIINPGTNQKLLIQDSIIQGIIDEDMGKRLKPAQKAFVGFEDVKNKKKLSAAEAIKENWLPYEAGNRFLEYQFITGGLVLPNVSGRIPVEEAIRKGLISGKTAQKLQDFNSYSKNLTCPKTKLKISYKEAMDRSMVEEKTGLRMLEASSFSSKGINSPYNLSSSGPNSRSGSRSGSRGGSRRGSFDATSSTLTTSTSTTFVSNISVN
eukprot:gi/632970370/ref/XP_007901614.1/ PREDICTED: desmoplakin [Callorhinchus milii]